MKRIIILIVAVATIALSTVAGPRLSEAAALDACSALTGPSAGVNARFGESGLSEKPRGVNVADLSPTPAAPFSTVFARSTDEIFANVSLTPDSETAWVSICWRYNGANLSAFHASLAPGKVQSSFSLYRKADHWPAGDYEAYLRILGTSETKSLKFAVTDSADKALEPRSAPVFADAGVVATWDRDVDEDPSALFATSFDLPHESNADRRGPFGVVKVTGADAWVTQSLKYQGVEIRRDAFETTDGEWRGLDTALIDDADAGDYELVLGIAGTSQTRSLKFTVVSPSEGAAPRLGQAYLGGMDTAGQTWCGPAKTIFGSHEAPTVYYNLTTGSANAGLAVATIKYRGIELQPVLFWYNLNRYLAPGERPGKDLIGNKSPWKGYFLIDEAATEMGIPQGAYDVSFALLAPAGGDKRSLSFSISDAAAGSAVKAYAKFEQSGALAAWDGCTAPANLRASGASFSAATLKGAAPKVVFKLSEGRDSEIHYTVRKDGRAIEAPGGGSTFTIDSGAVHSGGWGSLDAPLGKSPAGSYEVTLTLVETGETSRVGFVVTE